MELSLEAGKLLSNAEEEEADLKKENKFREIEKLYDWVIPLIETCQGTQGSNSTEINRILAIAYNNRGQSKYMQVKFQDAVEDYDAAIRYDPQFVVPYYNRGTILYRLCNAYGEQQRLANLQAAMNDFSKAVELEPENLEFQKGYTSCMAELEGTADSVKSLHSPVLHKQEV